MGFIRKVFTLTLIILAFFNQGLCFKALSQEQLSEYEFMMKSSIENKGGSRYPLKGNYLDAVGLFMNNSWQNVYLFKVKVNGVEHRWRFKGFDVDGNPYAIIEKFPEYLEPRKNITIELFYKIKLIFPREVPPPELDPKNSKTLKDIPIDLRKKYLNATGMWLTEDLTLRELALNKIRYNATNVFNITLSLVKWIEDNIKYPTEVKPPSYPNETYISREGDCDDMANLFVTLCRIIGIPSFTQMGYIYIKDLSRSVEPKLLKGRYSFEVYNVGGHGWAMAYVPPWGWLPFDFTYFRGATLRAGYIKSEKLIDRIAGSALIAYETVVYGNVTVSNYVEGVKGWMRDLEEYDLKWSTYLSMKPIEAYGPPPIITYGAPLSIATVIIVVVYLWRRKRREEEIF